MIDSSGEAHISLAHLTIVTSPVIKHNFDCARSSATHIQTSPPHRQTARPTLISTGAGMETNLPIRLRDQSSIRSRSTRDAVEDLRLRPSGLRRKLIQSSEDVSEDALEEPSSSLKLQRLIGEVPSTRMDTGTPPNMTESALEVYRLRQARRRDIAAIQGAESSSEDPRSPFIAYWEDVSDDRLEEAASSLERQRYISELSLSTRMDMDTPPNMTKWALDYYNLHERGNVQSSLADLPKSSERDTWAPVGMQSTEASDTRLNELMNRRSDQGQSYFHSPWQRLDMDSPRASSSDTKNGMCNASNRNRIATADE